MKRLLFFQQGIFSHTNDSVRRGLQAEFPGVEIRVVDVNRLLKRRRWGLAINAAMALRQYGWDLLTRKRDLDDAFFGTRCIFQSVRRLALKAHAEWPADCSFQTQSMFDCSAPDVPHFVYTDHTYLSCRTYPAYGQHIWAPTRPDWLIELERTVYEHAACVFTMSRNVANHVVHHYGIPTERVSCVGAGCNADVDRLGSIATRPERYASKRILFAGKDWQRKGGPELLAAFQEVRKRHTDATLVLVGVDPRIASMGVEVVGSVPIERVYAYYKSASVFCLPSLMEPFGIVFLEAMAAGLPVVGLRLGAARDFVRQGQTGVLVEPNNTDALESALIRLLSDPDRCCRMGVRARALVTQNYTWKSTCAAMATRMSTGWRY